MRGYAAVALYHPKSSLNVGSALRAAGCFGASLLVCQGHNYENTPGVTDTMKAWRGLPFLRVDDLRSAIPYNCVPVAVDLLPDAVYLDGYEHPERAFYVFGPENGTLGAKVTSWCRDRVKVPTIGCLNLAACVNVVLYDRMAKQRRAVPQRRAA